MSSARMPRGAASARFVYAYVVKGDGDVEECGGKANVMNAWTPCPVQDICMELGCIGTVREVLDEVLACRRARFVKESGLGVERTIAKL